MDTKTILEFVLFFVAGLAFVAAGAYFLSARFLQKLNAAAPDQSERQLRKNAFRAKGSGYVALALGAVTLVFAIMLFVFPLLNLVLSVAYMFFVLVAALVLIFLFR